MYQIITQIVGLIAAVLLIGSFQCKSSRKLIVVQLCANTTYLVHYMMLGAYSGCVSLFLSCIRYLIFSCRRPWAYWKGWPWLLVVANLIGTLLTWQSIFSILPCIGVVSLTIAGWTRNGKKIRLANLCFSSPAWLIYSYHSGSYFGIFSELFCISSVIISILRYGWDVLDSTT